MDRKTFLIEYEVFDIDGISLKNGEIKVENKMTVFEAQCSLEKYLKKRYKMFNRLTVYSCKPLSNTFLGDIDFGGFGDIFNGFGI